MSIQNRISLAFALTSFVALPSWADSKVVVDPRPLYRIAEDISRRFQVIVDYEDTTYRNDVDRSDRSLDDSGNILQADSKVFLRSRTFSIDLGKIPTSDLSVEQRTALAKSLLSRAISVNEQDRGATLFELRQGSRGLDVVGTDFVNARGYRDRFWSPMDRLISISAVQQPTGLVVQQLVSKMDSKDLRVFEGLLFGVSPGQVITINETNVPARDVLAKILSFQRRPVRISFLCAADGASCFLNTEKIPALLSKTD